MQIKYGAVVVNKDDIVMGTVTYIVRNAWTGEISKFMVQRNRPNNNLFLSIDDVLEVMGSEVKLRLSHEELANI
jgi:hypothetical protein